MTRTTQAIGQSPFHPITSFAGVADGSERVTPKEPAMFDLVGAISSARKTYEAGVSIRGAIAAGGETEPLVADLHARFKEQATAMGYMVTSIDDDAARETGAADDIDAMTAVEGIEVMRAAE